MDFAELNEQLASYKKIVESSENFENKLLEMYVERSRLYYHLFGDDLRDKIVNRRAEHLRLLGILNKGEGKMLELIENTEMFAIPVDLPAELKAPVERAFIYRKTTITLHRAFIDKERAYLNAPDPHHVNALIVACENLVRALSTYLDEEGADGRALAEEIKKKLAIIDAHTGRSFRQQFEAAWNSAKFIILFITAEELVRVGQAWYASGTYDATIDFAEVLKLTGVYLPYSIVLGYMLLSKPHVRLQLDQVKTVLAGLRRAQDN